MAAAAVQLQGCGRRQFGWFRHAVAKHEGVVRGLDQQGWCRDLWQVVAAGGTAVVVLGVAVAVQRCGEATVEIPEGAHAVQRAEALQGTEVVQQPLALEALLFVPHVGGTAEFGKNRTLS